MEIKIKEEQKSIIDKEIEISSEYAKSGNRYYRINENWFTCFNETYIIRKPTSVINKYDLPTDLITESISKEEYDNAFKELINNLILKHNEQG